MFLYVVIEALMGIVGGILIANRAKKAEGVTYGKLDRIGCVTNILLTVAYILVSPLYLIIGMISEPSGEGVLWILGLTVSVITASAALFCGLGLGFSVALRKKGKSGMSFAAQFMGVIGIALTFLLYGVFVGSLISPLN